MAHATQVTDIQIIDPLKDVSLLLVKRPIPARIWRHRLVIKYWSDANAASSPNQCLHLLIKSPLAHPNSFTINVNTGHQRLKVFLLLLCQALQFSLSLRTRPHLKPIQYMSDRLQVHP